MRHKISGVKTEIWHRVIEDLKRSGFEEVYAYGGADAGIDYGRYDLLNPSDGELIVFEWDNWSEGEIKGATSRLEALRDEYQLPGLVEI